MSALFAPDPHAHWLSPSAPALAPPRLLLVADAGLDPSIWDELSADASARGWQSATVSLDAASDWLSRRDHLRRLTAGYDALAAASPPHTHTSATAPVWVIATGYGAYLSTLLSQRRAIDRMLLHAPTVYADAGWDVPKAMLDGRPARADHAAETAPNDNLAFCAAGDYVGEVLILEMAAGVAGPHGVHVDYFHAFSRARSRHLHSETRIPGPGGDGPLASEHVAATDDATGHFRRRVAHWLKVRL